MSVKFRLEMGKLQALHRDVPAKADRIVEAVARELEGVAKVGAAVDTGAMRASIVVTKIGNALRRIGPTVYYAVFVELGSRARAAKPFLMPAFERVAPKLAQRLRELVA